MVIIRKMDIQDCHKISLLWEKLCIDQITRNHHADNGDISTLPNKRFDTYLDSNISQIFVAEFESQVVGFIDVWLQPKDFYFEIADYAYILHFYIEKSIPNYINVSLKLFRAAKNWAKEKNAPYLCTDVYYFNEPVQKWMQTCGLTPYKTRYVRKL
jgi:hypothetical protein